VIGGIAATAQMFVRPAYPSWALVIIATDVTLTPPVPQHSM
jgi:hypothetical protein